MNKRESIGKREKLQSVLKKKGIVGEFTICIISFKSIEWELASSIGLWLNHKVVRI